MSDPRFIRRPLCSNEHDARGGGGGGDSDNENNVRGNGRPRRLGSIPAHLLAGNRVEGNAGDGSAHDPHLPRLIAQLPEELP